MHRSALHALLLLLDPPSDSIQGQCRSALTGPNRLCAQVHAAAIAFHKEWSPDLRLLTHDCRHHTEALVQLLTGRPQSLQLLL